MPNYRIVFLDSDTVGNVPNLNRFAELGEYLAYPYTRPDEVVERITGREIVLANKVPITAEAIASSSTLRLICVTATGMNNVDLVAAKQHNIQVKNVEDYSTQSVAQHTIGLVLQLIHRFDYYNDYMYSGKYSQQQLFTHLGQSFWQLKDRRFGIIGLGNIGRQVAGVAEALGAKIAYYSTTGKNNNKKYLQLSLDELLQTSDVISVHASLNEKTRDLLGYDQLVKMLPHSLLINTGRGGIVNESDLARAIDEGVIRRAAVDVFEAEPIPLSHPYLQVKNKGRLLLTPHVGWASIEARTLLMDRVYQNIRQFIEREEEKSA